MATYGLIGKTLGHSFSKTFFTLKFEQEKRNDSYHNFEINDVEKLKDFLTEYRTTIKGFNVTHPYKEAIIPFLDHLNKEAKTVGAVNTVKITPTGNLVGYNTDHYGFAMALTPYLPLKKKTALILGTGGASKAIAYVLDTMQFKYKYVSRDKKENMLTYCELNANIIAEHYLIINCTPLGTYPNIIERPNIPYEHVTGEHLLFDLVYNPKETEFLKRGFAYGARVSNGLKMLEYQAKKAWTIWQK